MSMIFDNRFYKKCFFNFLFLFKQNIFDGDCFTTYNHPTSSSNIRLTRVCKIASHNNSCILM